MIIRSMIHRPIVERDSGAVTGTELYDIRETSDPIKTIAAENPDVVNQMMAYLSKP